MTTGRLNEQTCKEIRERYQQGREPDGSLITYRTLAKEFGVSHTAIGDAVRPEKYKEYLEGRRRATEAKREATEASEGSE